jgi:hypothetical protein
MPSFDEWFKRATGNDPFPYQRRFAEEGEIPQLVDVPTGLGKTAMALDLQSIVLRQIRMNLKLTAGALRA